ncbi:MAG: DUF2470 domain-containing protein [Actinophytocola sp.]|nr:DUF2470 domain-containing protein [Actinophytocola sp.]
MRRGPASLAPVITDALEPATAPLTYHVHDSGSVSVLLADDHPLVEAAGSVRDSGIAVLLELIDLAPVALRERTRALLWITGWLRVLPPNTARARAVMIAETTPDAALLDVGHGARLCRMQPSSLVLADADGTHTLTPNRFVDARPDPFSELEADWLRHLESDHPDVVEALTRHLPPGIRGGHPRPLGLDQFGLRLRVEADTGDHDVRLAFSHPATSQQDLAREMRRLVGCPFLAGVRQQGQQGRQDR